MKRKIKIKENDREIKVTEKLKLDNGKQYYIKYTFNKTESSLVIKEEEYTGKFGMCIKKEYKEELVDRKMLFRDIIGLEK